MANFTHKNQGFTLMEMLVAVAIFMLMMTVAAGIFTDAVGTQERVLMKQLAMNNTSYALEYMSRAMRMTVKDEDGTCLSTSGCNFENPGAGEQKVKFLNHEEECVSFFLKKDSEGDGRIMYENPSDFSGSQPFTPDELDIQNLQFKLNGECQNDNQQPTVTIILEAKVAEDISFTTQTTVTQRNLDVPR